MMPAEVEIITSMLVAFVVLGGMSAILKFFRMKFDAEKARGMSTEDKEAIRDLRAAVERIEERLKALEILTMEREREEKFGMKL